MAEQKTDKRQVWYVEFPSYRYNEDIKDLARMNNLRILDIRFQGDNKQCAKAPKLSLKAEYKPTEKE